VGVVADDPGKEMEFNVFHAKILREEVVNSPSRPLPIVREVILPGNPTQNKKFQAFS